MSQEISKPVVQSVVQEQGAVKAKTNKQMAKVNMPAAPVVPADAEIVVKKQVALKDKPEQDDDLQDKVANWLNPSEEQEAPTTILLAQASAATTGAPATATDAGPGSSASSAPAAPTVSAPAAPATPAAESPFEGKGWVVGLGALALAASNKSSDTTPPEAPKVNAIGTANVVNAASKAAGVTISGTAEANSTVTVTWGTATATATTNATGVWTTTIASTSVPADGTSNVVVSAKDGSGNKSPDTTVAVKVDATAPTAPVVNAVATDNAVNASEKAAGVTITGTAEAAASVAVTWGSTVKTVTASGAGTWTATFASSDLPADASTTVSAVATDAVGNASAAGTKAVVVDTAAPTTPVISAVSTDNAVNAAEKTAGVAVSGTAEAGASVAVTWGTTVKTVTASSAGAFTATFTSAEIPADADSSAITAIATDAVGNASTAGTKTVAIDTAVPGAPVVSAVSTDNAVNAAEKTAGVVVSGTAEAGASVAVTWGSIVKTVTATSAGAWTTPFASAEVPADAATTISAVTTDAAGNASAAGTRAVTVDTAAPSAPTVNAVATDNIVNATEKAAGVAVAGTAEAGASVAVTWGSTVKTVTASSTGDWTATFASADLPADAASTTVSAVATDAVGNASTAGTKAVTIDTAAPTISVLSANSTAKTITLTYSEALNATDLPATTAFNVSIGGVDNAVSSVAVSGSTIVLTLTNAFAAGAVSVAYTDPTTGNDTAAIQDLAGNDSASFTNTVVADGYIRGATVYIDVNKNGEIDAADYLVGTTDANGNILIPGSAPAGSIIATGGVNMDTGAANTMILKAPQGAATINPLTTLVQAVIDKALAANPNTVVDAALIQQASTKVADSLGLTSSLGGASLLSYDPIAEGNTAVQKAAAQVATIVSLAGNAEAGSSVISKLTDVINTQTSGAPAISLSDTATLTSVLPSSTSDAVKTAITAATTSISTAASLEAITTAQSTAIDKTAPDAPKSVEFTAVTKSAQPVIKISFDATKADGSALIAGDTLTLKDGAAVLGDVVRLTAADIAKGYVEVTAPTLTEGAHSITASFTDKAGNASAASTAKTLTVDLTAPVKPSITAFADNSGITTDTITNDATPTLTISAEAGSVVEVFSGTTSIGKAKETSTAGVFTFTSETLKDGTYSLTATSTDAAGNSSTSNAQAITVDTTKPATPVISNALEGASAVTLTILGEAGSKVDVYSGTTKLGSAVESTTTAGQFSYSAALVNSGKYSFSAKAADTAGNTADSAAQSIIFAAGQSFQTVTPGSVELKLISSDTTKATFGIYGTGSSIAIDEFQFAVAINTSKVTYQADTAVFPATMSAFDSYENGVVGFGGFSTSAITSSATPIVTFSLNWVAGPTAIDLPVSISSLAGVSKPTEPTYKFVPGSGGAVVGADDVADLFLIGSGQVTVTGGKGADVFALTSASNNTLTITDFTTGTDAIDVSRFITSLGYTSTKGSGDAAANVALTKALALTDLGLVSGNSATLDNVAGYVFEAATSGTNKGTLHLIIDKDAATGAGHVNLVQLDIVLGANSTGFNVADLISAGPAKPVI